MKLGRSKFDVRSYPETSHLEPRTSNLPKAERGVTLLEMIVTVAIVMVLASVAMPLSKYSTKRTQELELRQKLREMRSAIDEFHKDWARDGDILTGQLCVKNKSSCKEVTGVTGYPKELTTLLEVKLSGAEATVREKIPIRRYLRRIPVDPMTGTTDWGLRCYKDPPDARDWCRDDVFDVYTKSDDAAMDKSKYREW
jgi:general secretion pathway protein G